MNGTFYHTTTTGGLRENALFSSRGILGKSASAEKIGAKSYTYGFNGMEKDDEVKGNGNSLDFGARVYD